MFLKPLRKELRTSAILLCFLPLAAGFAVWNSGIQLRAESANDPQKWTVQGSMTIDTAKVAPSGSPSFKLDPKSKAVLKLRDSDGSGKVTLHIFDDGTVASPDNKRSVGPRWGLTQADGRIFLASIMYGSKLHKEGALCLIDADSTEKRPWMAMKYLSPRGTGGWKQWVFDYNPDQGLKISIDGKPVAEKYFNWNLSKATGFNGLVLYGDDTVEGTPQTIWIADVNYELGEPMKVKPDSKNIALAGPIPTPVPEAEIANADTGEPASMLNFKPGLTLADDLKNMRVPLVANYAAKHPRLLFSESDRASLQNRAKMQPELWKAVLEDTKMLTSRHAMPTPDLVVNGGKYWLVERIQSGALVWYLEGNKECRDAAIQWMLAYAKEPVWGTLYRPNLDLAASWYLYHVAIGYDILWNELNEEQRKTIRDGLALHARAIFADHDPANTKDKIRYDQNHTYIPIVALTAASLAIVDEVPEAKVWLNRSYAILRRCRYVLGEDGYYHEGFGYWTYALHWQVRGAELLGRATGEQLFDLPALRNTWMHALYLSLPGFPSAFDIGDTGGFGGWKEDRRPEITVTNHSMMWAVASATRSPESQTAGNFYYARQPEKDYPSSAFLWFNPEVKAKEFNYIKPYHYFADHDVVSWRSGWGADATCYLFRCGPPLGHRAAEKLGEFKDWTMNCGHVHPDIGSFWMYAKGTYLAVDTGYSTRKWTQDHNTLLIDGKGQGMDGSYWNDRGIPYKQLNQARITKQYLSNDYGFISGEFGGVYAKQAPGVALNRSLLFTERWMLVIDEMNSDAPHDLTWLCHADAPFHAESAAFVAHLPKASLAVIPLAPEIVTSKVEPSIISSGKAPTQSTPQQRGYQLELSLKQPSQTAKMINLLVPLGSSEKCPDVKLEKQENHQLAIVIHWPSGKIERVELNQAWEAGSDSIPAKIVAQ